MSCTFCRPLSPLQYMVPFGQYNDYRQAYCHHHLHPRHCFLFTTRTLHHHCARYHWPLLTAILVLHHHKATILRLPTEVPLQSHPQAATESRLVCATASCLFPCMLTPWLHICATLLMRRISTNSMPWQCSTNLRCAVCVRSGHYLQQRRVPWRLSSRPTP